MVKIHLPARSPMNPNRPESLVVVSVVRSAWSLGAVCPITLAPPIGSPSVPRTIPEMMADGIDAPICQDGRSGGFTELLARAEVCHDALIDLPSEKAFEAPG